MEVWESDMVAEMKRERDALREENARLRAALEIIAGKRQCLDNLMSNVDVAHAVLAEVKPGSACADRAETVEQTHARWSAQSEEVK